MSDETYYTVLNVAETASPTEIKAAYRNLIKQVHPDTLSTLSPYLKRIAEDKAKEITEAYSVLSSSVKRRDYDRQLAEYRRQSSPPTPSPSTPPPAQQAASPAGPQPKVVRRPGYNWAPLMRWSREHPMVTVTIVVLAIFCVSIFYSDSNVPQQSESKAPSFTNNAKAASKGAYSEYPCDFRDKVSPIDGKPCSEKSNDSIPAPPPGFTIDAKSTPPKPSPTVLVSGTYLGTVHNQTVNLSSSFTVVLHQTNTGVLDGCMEVKLPLVGSGALQGSVRGSHIGFVVADITFQGEASKNTIAGSYVVSRQDGQQLGDFRLTKQRGIRESYGCADGALVEFEVVSKPRPNPEAVFAVVGQYYTSIYKRCAFLPQDNYRRCNYQPETVAKLKSGDRVKVLSRMVRAENGDDIYKVRTEQGWEGWIDARGVTLESQ